MKEHSFLLIIVNVLVVVAIIVALGALFITSGDSVAITRANSISIEYLPNQKQTTFFGREEYQPETGTPTPPPIRRNAEYQLVPTQVVEPTNESSSEEEKKYCPPDTIDPEGCICKSPEGDYESYICTDPTNPDRTLLYVSRPEQKSYSLLRGPLWNNPRTITETNYEQSIRNPSCSQVCIEISNAIE